MELEDVSLAQGSSSLQYFFSRRNLRATPRQLGATLEATNLAENTLPTISYKSPRKEGLIKNQCKEKKS